MRRQRIGSYVLAREGEDTPIAESCPRGNPAEIFRKSARISRFVQMPQDRQIRVRHREQAPRAPMAFSSRARCRAGSGVAGNVFESTNGGLMPSRCSVSVVPQPVEKTPTKFLPDLNAIPAAGRAAASTRQDQWMSLRKKTRSPSRLTCPAEPGDSSSAPQ